MTDSDKPHLNTVDFFCMSGNCLYQFDPAQYVSTIPMSSSKGYLATNRDFDLYFVGMGKSRSSAMYDWKAKFHGHFQRFEKSGASTEKEKELYKRMKEAIDLELYKVNRTILKMVKGTVTNCRLGILFPCSYKLDGSSNIYQVPEYYNVDTSFLLLEKGTPFRAVFEYQPEDYTVRKILFGEKLDTNNS